MATNITSNITLGNIFGRAWKSIRFTVVEGRELHMAHDICKQLKISNVTNAVKGIDGTHRVSVDNREKMKVPEWNKYRKVHLLDFTGVLQLVMNNNSRGCKAIRNRIACAYLPSREDLVLHDEVDDDTAELD